MTDYVRLTFKCAELLQFHQQRIRLLVPPVSRFHYDCLITGFGGTFAFSVIWSFRHARSFFWLKSTSPLISLLTYSWLWECECMSHALFARAATSEWKWPNCNTNSCFFYAKSRLTCWNANHVALRKRVLFTPMHAVISCRHQSYCVQFLYFWQHVILVSFRVRACLKCFHMRSHVLPRGQRWQHPSLRAFTGARNHAARLIHLMQPRSQFVTCCGRFGLFSVAEASVNCT